jgi:hypothetical protein
MQDGNRSSVDPRRTPDRPAGPDPIPFLRGFRIGAVVGANALGTFAILAFLLPTWPAGLLLLLLILATFALAYTWGLTRDRLFLAIWVAVSVVAATVSLVTGWHNGLTEEPFVTPAFAQLWPNLYGSPISIVYDQYGTHFALTDLFNVYLPGLAFAAVPGINYKWTALGAWVGTLYLLRSRGTSLVLWGGSWVGLMAANGFNDFVPVLTLTLTFVTLVGAPSKVAEVVSLGLKQFANVVVVGVHLYHRRWKDALLAVVITAAILAPFAYLSPGGVVCHAILIQPNDCKNGVGSVLGVGVVDHLNYLLWPLWVLAVFGPSYVRSLRIAGPGGIRGRVGELLRRWSGNVDDSAAPGSRP